MNRDFKGVWIPKEIWLNEELTLLEKIIFVEIDSLDNENHCIAGNEYFAEFCNCSESKVSKAIKKLEDLNMVERLEFDGRHRKLRVVKSAIKPSKKCYAESQNLHSNNTSKSTNSKKEKVVSKDTTTEFAFGNQKPKKQNLYTKCVSLIDQKTNDKEIRSLLIDWLNILLEKYKYRGKILYVNVFKGKLNMLDNFDEKDWKEIIKYNIQKGYEGFYPIPSYNYKTDLKDKPWEKGVKSEAYTEEEKRQIEREREEMEARGERVWY